MLVIREIQIKTSMRYHFIATQMNIVKHQIIKNISEARHWWLTPVSLLCGRLRSKALKFKACLSKKFMRPHLKQQLSIMGQACHLATEGSVK
jgi:hypothetical protein